MTGDNEIKRFYYKLINHEFRNLQLDNNLKNKSVFDLIDYCELLYENSQLSKGSDKSLNFYIKGYLIFNYFINSFIMLHFKGFDEFIKSNEYDFIIYLNVFAFYNTNDIIDNEEYSFPLNDLRMLILEYLDDKNLLKFDVAELYAWLYEYIDYLKNKDKEMTGDENDNGGMENENGEMEKPRDFHNSNGRETFEEEEKSVDSLVFDKDEDIKFKTRFPSLNITYKEKTQERPPIPTQLPPGLPYPTENASSLDLRSEQPKNGHHADKPRLVVTTQNHSTPNLPPLPTPPNHSSSSHQLNASGPPQQSHSSHHNGGPPNHSHTSHQLNGSLGPPHHIRPPRSSTMPMNQNQWPQPQPYAQPYVQPYSQPQPYTQYNQPFPQPFQQFPQYPQHQYSQPQQYPQPYQYPQGQFPPQNGHHDKSIRMKELSICGLKNFGSSCYINSTIQIIFGINEFKQIFQNGEYRKYINNPKFPMARQSGANNSKESVLLSESISALLRSFQMHGGSSIAPTKFIRISSILKPDFNIPYEQQDSQEFLLFILDRLHEELSHKPGDIDFKSFGAYLDQWKINIPENEFEGYFKWYNSVINFEGKSPINSLFQGHLQNKLICNKCNFESISYSPFTILSLPIPETGANAVDLSDCLRYYTQDELLKGENAWHCPKCHKEEENALDNHPVFTKKSGIFKFSRRNKSPSRSKSPSRPAKVDTSIKRLTFIKMPQVLFIHLSRFSFNLTDKLDTNIVYPLNLKFNNYSNEISYRLTGIINHYGTLKSGHYTSLVDKSDDYWCYFDDENVRLGVHHGNYKMLSRDVYVLVYERVE